MEMMMNSFLMKRKYYRNGTRRCRKIRVKVKIGREMVGMASNRIVEKKQM
jgi:hypothetical protein